MDREQLFKLRFAPVSWNLYAWHSYQNNIDGVTFTNDAWYPLDKEKQAFMDKPLVFFQVHVQLDCLRINFENNRQTIILLKLFRCNDYYSKIADTMIHGLVYRMKGINMTEEEFSCMLAITLFRPG